MFPFVSLLVLQVNAYQERFFRKNYCMTVLQTRFNNFRGLKVRSGKHISTNYLITFMAHYLPEQLMVTETVKKFPASIGPEVSPLYSQKPTIGTYPEPVQSKLHARILILHGSV
jgi:hypothetical protein